MRIEIDKDQLMEAIGIADSIIPSRSVNAILSNCLFNVIKDEIEIISTDNEIGIKTRVEGVADGEVSFTVEGKRFYGILKELPRGVVYIDVSSSSALDITSKAIKGHYKLLGTSAEDYPDLPAFYNKEEVEIKQSEFKALIKKVMYAAASDNLKPVYNGIYIVPDVSKKITFIATDSRRLAIITKEMDAPVEIEEGVIRAGGINKKNYFKIEDRKTAIEQAIHMASNDDIVVIAGRGHERFQDYNGVKIEIDDREVVRETLGKKR